MKLDSTTLLGGVHLGLRLPSELAQKPGALAATARTLDFRDSRGDKQSIVELTDALYPFESHRFVQGHPENATIKEGPAKSVFLSAYADVDWAQNPEFFDVVGGIQKWVVPKSGYYLVEASGGGTGLAAQRAAQVSGYVYLSKGERLSILVGCGGLSSFNGCGGTFFVSDARGPLLIAGGAGGIQNSPAADAASARLVFSPWPLTTASKASGGACGGGGYAVDGGGGSRSFLSGGVGGTAVHKGTERGSGRFGGGGGGFRIIAPPDYSYTCGGGGGALGGNAVFSYNNDNLAAGGGTCYKDDSVIDATMRHVSTRGGSVFIQYVGELD